MIVLQKVLEYFQSIAKSIAKSQKYFKKYCKISKVLKKVLQNFEVLQKVFFYFALRKFFSLCYLLLNFD